MRLKLLAVVVLLVVAGGAVFVSMGGFTTVGADATTLLTSPATVTDVTDEIVATGTVEAVWEYALAFGADPTVSDGGSDSADPIDASGAGTVAWPVSAVNVAVGDRVTAGDVLASADTADLEAQIDEASRAAKSTALQLASAEVSLDDANNAEARRQAQIALYSAQSADSRAGADLAALVAQRDLATLTAPVDGVVTNVIVRVGTDAPSGAAITLISADLRVVTSVVESDVAAISVGHLDRAGR